MKTTIIASALLAATAAAQPHNHARHGHASNVGHKNAHRHLAERKMVTEVEWQTVYQTITEIVGESTTYMVTGPVSSPTPMAAVDSSSSETTTSVKSETTSVALPTSSTSAFVGEQFTSSTEQPVYTPPPSSYAPPPPPPPQSSSVYVPPPPPPPHSSTPVYVPPPPPPPPTSSYVPPPAPSPSPSTPVYQPPPSSGGGGGSGDHSGDITFYAIGMGSCGQDYSGQDSTAPVVALSHADMNTGAYANPNANPNCGRKITIYAGGKTAEATVVDTCMGCEKGSIDVAEGVFTRLLGDTGIGRATCSWSFN